MCQRRTLDFDCPTLVSRESVGGRRVRDLAFGLLNVNRVDGRTLCALLLTTVSCAHTLAGSYDPEHRQACNAGACYVVGALDGSWNFLHREGAAVAFFNPATNAIIESNASCRDDSEAAALEALTNHLLIGYTERHVATQALVTIDQREALHTIIDAKLDGVPMTLDLYVLKRNGCIFDLSLASPPAAHEQLAAPFAAFVSGFHQTWLARGKL
jgi:hypothetical protein